MTLHSFKKKKDVAMRKLLAATALATVLASSVPLHAADMSTKAPIYAAVVSPALSWTGFYVGINGGAGIGTAGAASTPLSVLVPNDSADRVKGWLLGGQVGARKQVGVWVFGVESDIDWTSISNRSTSSNTVRRTFFATQLADTTSSQTNGAKVDWLSTVTASLGVTPWQQVLWSVKGGLAFGKVSWDNTQNVSTSTLSPAGAAFCAGGVISCPNGAGGATESKVKYGWTLGTVVEVALDQRWSLKGEVDYIDLGRTGGATGSQKVDLWVTKGGINFRF